MILANGSQAIDLSNLRFRFEISASDVETPNTARIRVYNLSRDLTTYATEFSQVVLSAGYGNNPGQIFKGTVKQFRKGRESNVDSFLDIFAADGDLGYNFGIVNTTVPAGSTEAQRLQKYAAALGYPLDPNAPSYLSSTGGILPRGKVLFGLARNYMRDLAETNNVRWSIQNGVVTLIPLAGYLPGDIVVINSATGMVGVPEATDQGILVQTLLNPKIGVGRRVQINNKDITSTLIKQQFFPGYSDLNLPATVDSVGDGIYRVIVIEHEGDTRDVSWYTRLTCLLIDPSAAPDAAVAPYG